MRRIMNYMLLFRILWTRLWIHGPKRIIIYVVEGLVSFSISNSYSLVQNWAKSDSRDAMNYELYVII